MLLRTLLAVLLISCAAVAQEVPEKTNKRPAQEPVKSEPYDKAGSEEMAKCVALKTEKGLIEIEMFPVTAPVTVRNFLNLVAIGAFDKTTFSRVVPGFVIQGGNLYSNPNLSNEMKFRAQRNIPDEANLVRHERGIVSMARTDEPNSANTDFFILVRSDPGLDNKFAAFGRVVKGMDVVDEINAMPVDDETPKIPVVITASGIGDCVFEPIPAPKVNELPRFGLRGTVRSVRTKSFDQKGKRTVLDSGSWAYEYSESELVFNRADGHLVEIRYFDENGNILRTETFSSIITGPGKPPERRELLKDATESLLREMVFMPAASDAQDFEAFDGKQKLIGQGVIKINENGRVLLKVWQRLNEGGDLIGTFTETVTYDPYGFEESIIRSGEKTTKDSYARYEYTDYDDNANWTERKVFDSADAKTPVRTEKRVIVYFE